MSFEVAMNKADEEFLARVAKEAPESVERRYS
jgi:hypothetical protein